MEPQFYPRKVIGPKALMAGGVALMLLGCGGLAWSAGLFILLVIAGTGLLGYGWSMLGVAKAGYEVADDGLTCCDAFGGRTRVAWWEMTRLDVDGRRAIIRRHNGPDLRLAASVTDREALLATIGAHIDRERRKQKLRERFDLSELVGEDEVVTVSGHWRRWWSVVAILLGLFYVAFFVSAVVERKILLIVQAVLQPLVYATIVAQLWARQNRVVFDRQGMQFTTRRQRVAVSWDEIESMLACAGGMAIKTRRGVVTISPQHENRDRLFAVVNEVLETKAAGLPIDTDAGAAPNALSRTRMASDDPADRAVSRVDASRPK